MKTAIESHQRERPLHVDSSATISQQFKCKYSMLEILWRPLKPNIEIVQLGCIVSLQLHTNATVKLKFETSSIIFFSFRVYSSISFNILLKQHKRAMIYGLDSHPSVVAFARHEWETESVSERSEAIPWACYVWVDSEHITHFMVRKRTPHISCFQYFVFFCMVFVGNHRYIRPNWYWTNADIMKLN